MILNLKNIGDVSKSVDVPITLNCAAGTNIKATVTSSAGYIDAKYREIKTYRALIEPLVLPFSY